MKTTVARNSPAEKLNLIIANHDNPGNAAKRREKANNLAKLELQNAALLACQDGEPPRQPEERESDGDSFNLFQKHEPDVRDATELSRANSSFKF